MNKKSTPLSLRSIVVVALLPLVLSSGTFGDDYKAAVLKEPCPKEIAKDIQKLVQSEGIRVANPEGKNFVDIWLLKEIPVKKDKKELGLDFGMVEEGSILGVVKFHNEGTDFRGNSFPAGVYTLRYGIQPQDGDHTGVSETRDFLLLCSPKVDVKPDPMSTDDAVELSTEVTGQEHPTIFYLMKIFEEAKKVPQLVENKELEYWILDCQIPGKPKEKGPIRLGIVLVGEAEEV